MKLEIRSRTAHYFFVLFPLFLLVACGHWGWEDVESDHEPTLNVLAVIILGGEEESFVIVSQTLELEGSDYRFEGFDTTYYGPDSLLDISVKEIYRYAYIVEDAEVYMTDGVDTSWFFFKPSYPDAFEYRTIYRDTLRTFRPKPGTDYYLSISTPDGRTVRGSVTTPPLPHIYDEQVPDTVYNRRTFTIPFNEMDESLHLRLKTASLRDWRCGSERVSTILDNTDTTWTSRVINCADVYGWPEEDDPDSIFIQLLAVEENYYQYFVKHSSDADYTNFLLGGEGNSGATSGIEGGFGLFGAMASDAIDRVYVP